MTDVAASGPSVEAASPGRKIAAAREARGLTVGDIATRLKFAPKQIEALEADEYLALPGITFIRGMVRSYSRFVGLDPEQMVREVNDKIAPPQTMVKLHDLKVPFQPGQQKTNKLWLGLSAAILLGVGLVAADWILRERERVELASAPPAPPTRTEPQAERGQPVPLELKVPEPAAAPPAAGAPSEASGVAAAIPLAAAPSELPAPRPPLVGGKRVKLAFARDSWVQVKDGEGTTLMNRLSKAGTEEVVEGKPPLSLVIGNASGVKVTYDGKQVALAPATKNDIARLTLE